MAGKLYRPAWVTRENVQAQPDWLWAFGDNMIGQGLGGQAGAMRGEPNSVGVPTKWRPSMDDIDFFYDHQMSVVQPYIDLAMNKLAKHLAQGGSVAIPQDGLGTGLSELPKRAPAIQAYIDTWISKLAEQAETCYIGKQAKC